MNDKCLHNNGKEDEGYNSSVGSDDHFGLVALRNDIREQDVRLTGRRTDILFGREFKSRRNEHITCNDGEIPLCSQPLSIPLVVLASYYVVERITNTLLYRFHLRLYHCLLLALR